jgi:heat shock protein HslJ/chitodextrinase
MQRAIRYLSLVLTIVGLSVLVAACDATEPGPEPDQLTSEAATRDTPEAPIIEPEATVTLDGEVEATPESTNPDLVAAIVSGESAGVGKPFTFDATQSDPGSLEIVQYQWNMGDGTTLFGNSVQHAYGQPGIYTITLTVVDEEGNVDVAAKAVEIVTLDEETPEAGQEDFALAGTAWALDYPLRGTTVTLEFGQDTLTGSTGCNDYSASYAAEAAEGTPADVTVTTIAVESSKLCTSEIMAQEQGFLNALSTASTVIVIDQTLTLETGSGTLTFSQVTTAD